VNLGVRRRVARAGADSEFTRIYFVGVPDVRTLPLIMFTRSFGSDYQIAAVTALILLVPSIAFMLLIEPPSDAEMLARVGCSQFDCAAGTRRFHGRISERERPNPIFGATRGGPRHQAFLLRCRH
jgi:hypothetical protein